MSSSPQHEPTMEEILASIRKIISEDSTDAQPAPAAEAKSAPVATPPMAPAPVAAAVEADVLELTQEFHETEPQQFRTPAPEPEHVRAVVPPENDVVFETIEEPAVTSEAPVSSHEDIFSDKTRRAMEDTFAHIEPEEEDAPRRPAASPVAPIDGRTVEAVFERAVREAFDPVVNNWLGTNADAVVERMKPLIREWMDDHFPALLEGAVRNEVARVVKARGTKR